MQHFSDGLSSYQWAYAAAKALKFRLTAPDFTWIDPGPPANGSDEMCAELAKLHELAARRPEKKAEIECEMNITCYRLGDFSMAEETRARYPVTYDLLMTELKVIEPMIQLQKRRFDRVRPSQADPTLTTLIPVPNHAAYPSGHTTQVTLLAYTLSYLNPSGQQAYLQDSLRIGRNREIAGLHYPSDTEAGRRLGKAFFDYLLQQPWYQKELALAAQEWPAPTKESEQASPDSRTTVPPRM